MSGFGKRGAEAATATPDKVREPINWHTFFWSTKTRIWLVAIAVSLWTVVYLLPKSEAPVPDEFAGIEKGLLTDRIVIDRPSEPMATYTLISLTKDDQGRPVAINTRYSDNTGWAYTKAVYDCRKSSYRVLASAFNKAGLSSSKSEEPHFVGLVPGSSASQVAHLVCGFVTG